MSLIVLGPASLLLARRAWRDGLVSGSYVVSLAAIVLFAFGARAVRPEVNLTNKMVVADHLGAALARGSCGPGVCMDKYEASVWHVPSPLTVNANLVRDDIKKGKPRKRT